MRNPRRFLTTKFTLAVMLISGAWGGLAAQTQPPAAPTTGVLVLLTVELDTPRQDVMMVLPSEVRDTVRLYLEGKISHWFARSDGRGVVFIMNCSSVAEARPSPRPCR